ncbi:MAG: hypothetical protein H7210_08115 [Pyrinomonadaceae bacterium]|nr:hypothetical protein [Phycisphaerales bacterium]
MSTSAAITLIEIETRALLARLEQVRPFSLHLPMVMAAAPSQSAWSAIENYLSAGRGRLRRACFDFLRWLRGPGKSVSAEKAQRRFSFLRLNVLAGMNQFDIFADALVQRSQHGLGEWLGGLDVVAGDALELAGEPFAAPPVVCYLDRGHGAAIRRARTRLPGGGDNPVAIIKVPRERMIGSGIASSLVHEVGHQAAALLDLVNPLRKKLQERAARDGPDRPAWECFARWISEIVADFWSVAHIGIGSTLGLMGVVALPRVFVFRTSAEDPHPTPWIRVKISAAIGSRLYPDAQWANLASVWEELYPLDRLDQERRLLFEMIERALPEFVELICGHQPQAMRGETLESALPLDERTPAQLRDLHEQWKRDPGLLARLRPTVAMAMVGQAKAGGKMGAREESRVIGRLLRFWAYSSTVDTVSMCAQARKQRRAVALST